MVSLLNVIILINKIDRKWLLLTFIETNKFKLI